MVEIKSKNEEIIDPISYIQSAIWYEIKENPYCPVAADLFQELLQRYQSGDNSALELALEIAKDTLKPREQKSSFFTRIKALFQKRHI